MLLVGCAAMVVVLRRVERVIPAHANGIGAHPDALRPDDQRPEDLRPGNLQPDVSEPTREALPGAIGPDGSGVRAG
jgi:hypothetical protein